METKNRWQVGKIKGGIMGVHFRNVNDVLAILRDVYTYIAITQKNDELGNRIMSRINVILDDNEQTAGDTNEQEGKL
tara:strand:+ start:2104 stop:2334 length:231 start_codon:yes stop_codon:yes gene_type:complete